MGSITDSKDEQDEWSQMFLQADSKKVEVDSKSKAIQFTNLGNTAYMGELYLGAPVSQKVSNIIFDTGSSVLAVVSKSSKNCPQTDDVESPCEYYDHLASQASIERETDVNK